MEDIKNAILNYIIKEFLDDDGDEVGYDTPLISSGYIDSFSIVSLSTFVENRFKIKIPQDKVTPKTFDSVNSISEIVGQYLK